MVTDRPSIASAVLIRSLHLTPLPPWLKQHKQPNRIAAGPGKLCRIMQIDLNFNNIPLKVASGLWLEHRSLEFTTGVENGKITIVQTSRIGISQGKNIPWRWYIADCPAISR